MKNRIRLGISSVSNRLKTPDQSVTRPMSISEIAFDNVPSFTGNFSSVSANDLDEMFDKNLKLLNELEKDELSDKSNVGNKSQRYQSSLNIYISPQKNWRHSTGTYYSNCDVMPLGKPQKSNLTYSKNDSNQLTKSPLYSSYETLYDNLKQRKNTQRYQNDDPMSQSLIDTSSRSINEFLKANGNKSSDSDRTLKSLTSDDSSSSVSSIESQENTKEIRFRDYKTSIVYLRNVYQSNGNSPKFNSALSGNNSRPTSCYVDSKFGLYTPRSNLIAIRNQEMKDKSNIVISKPIGRYPSRSNVEHLPLHNMHNSNQNLSIQSDGSLFNENLRHPVRINDKQYLSTKSPQYSSTNILNNHLISLTNHIPISVAKSYANISSLNKPGKQIQKISQPNRRSYISGEEKTDTRNLIKVNSIKQNKQMNSSVLNDNNNSKIPNQNFPEFSMEPVKNGDRNFRDEENCISTSRCYQIQRFGKI